MACCSTYNSSLLYISNSFVFALVYKCWKCLVLSVVEVSKQLHALELLQIYFQFADAKKTKHLVRMAGPKYGFWSASTHEVCNGIAKKLLGESHI